MPFTTVSDYLFLLREAGLAAAPAGSTAMFLLAAAVSDFYVPQTEMVRQAWRLLPGVLFVLDGLCLMVCACQTEHKIQSQDGSSGLHLHLQGVPKTLGALKSQWAPEAFVVSFKVRKLQQ